MTRKELIGKFRDVKLSDWVTLGDGVKLGAGNFMDETFSNNGLTDAEKIEYRATITFVAEWMRREL
jgi:hypothetical protein